MPPAAPYTSPQAGREGPWVTYARMVTLRTPKHLTGLEYGTHSHAAPVPVVWFGSTTTALHLRRSPQLPSHLPPADRPSAVVSVPAGMPSLTFQAYYEARFGQEKWEALDKIPKELWWVFLGLSFSWMDAEAISCIASWFISLFSSGGCVYFLDSMLKQHGRWVGYAGLHGS